MARYRFVSIVSAVVAVGASVVTSPSGRALSGQTTVLTQSTILETVSNDRGTMDVEEAAPMANSVTSFPVPEASDTIMAVSMPTSLVTAYREPRVNGTTTISSPRLSAAINETAKDTGSDLIVSPTSNGTCIATGNSTMEAGICAADSASSLLSVVNNVAKSLAGSNFAKFLLIGAGVVSALTIFYKTAHIVSKFYEQICEMFYLAKLFKWVHKKVGKDDEILPPGEVSRENDIELQPITLRVNIHPTLNRTRDRQQISAADPGTGQQALGDHGRGEINNRRDQDDRGRRDGRQ
jgi:hypothetical protein